MRLHLIKLCVGVDTVEELAGRVEARIEANRKSGRGRLCEHVTRMFPRRAAELLEGGSLYWVMKGLIRARQKILALEPVEGEDGVTRCAIRLEPAVAPIEPRPRRAFQGWRYLTAYEAPNDLDRREVAGGGARLRAELAELGLS